MSSWIGWLSRPSKSVSAPLQSAKPLAATLQTRSHSPEISANSTASTHGALPTEATPSARGTDSPTKPRLYPAGNSSAAAPTPSAPLLSDVLRDDWMTDTGTTPRDGDDAGDTDKEKAKQLSDKHLARMKEENVRLKSVLQQIQRNPSTSSSSSPSPTSSKPSASPYSFQHVGHIPGGNGFLLSIPSLSTPSPPSAFFKAATSTTAAAASAAPPAPPSYDSVQKEKNDAVVCHGAHSTVLVKQVKEDDDNENAVALLDLNEVDWWVMVNGAEGKDKDSTPGETSTTSVELDDDDCVHREGGLRIVKSHLAYDNEGYVLIDENDFIHALSDFISQSIARQYPEAERIPSQELQKILRQAFAPIKQPSKIGKAYQWAQFLYQSYSWGSCAWSLYREPFYVKLVLRGAMKAAQWLLVLVI